MVKALNCSPAELGENLTYTYRRYDFSDEQTTPAEFAERLVDRQQPAKENAAAVMGACREMAAHELAAEPTIRGWVRQQLPEKTTISTGAAAARVFPPKVILHNESSLPFCVNRARQAPSVRWLAQRVWPQRAIDVGG